MTVTGDWAVPAGGYRAGHPGSQIIGSGLSNPFYVLDDFDVLNIPSQTEYCMLKRT